MSTEATSATDGSDPFGEGELDPEDERIAVMLAEGLTHAVIATTSQPRPFNAA